MLDYLLLVVGLAALLVGGDVLVKGAVGLAERLKIPALIIGLTIVAFGTSAPELFISIQAALAGVSGIAIGNVVGSNIANVLLVMGLPALIAASRCDDAGIGRSILVMIGFTVVFMALLFDRMVTERKGSSCCCCWPSFSTISCALQNWRTTAPRPSCTRRSAIRPHPCR